MAFLPQGLYGSEFYKLVAGALSARGWTLESFIAVNPNYWFDEEKWKEIYDLASIENPERTFYQKLGNQNIPVMATYLSDDAETPLLTNEGYESRSGDIPRMGQGFAFSAKAYEDLLKLQRSAAYSESDINDKVYAQFLKDVKNLFQSIHSQRTFTGLQAESLGQYVSTKLNNAGGIQNLKIDLNLPSDNVKKCGGYSFGSHSKGTKYAWSSASAKPLGDLEDMFYYAKHNHLASIDYAKSVFRMSMATYDVLKAHADTRERVAMWKTGNLIDSNNISKFTVTDADLAAFMKEQGLPAISVDETYGFTKYLDSATMTIKLKEQAAFAENRVVLRPSGKFGEIQWARVSNIFNTADAPVIYSEGGAIAVQQDRAAKGVRYNAESLCVPVPYAIDRCLHLKTNEAAD